MTLFGVEGYGSRISQNSVTYYLNNLFTAFRSLHFVPLSLLPLKSDPMLSLTPLSKEHLVCVCKVKFANTKQNNQGVRKLNILVVRKITNSVVLMLDWEGKFQPTVNCNLFKKCKISFQQIRLQKNRLKYSKAKFKLYLL